MATYSAPKLDTGVSVFLLRRTARCMCKALNPSANYITPDQLGDMVTMVYVEHMHHLRNDIIAANLKAKAVTMGACSLFRARVAPLPHSHLNSTR